MFHEILVLSASILLICVYAIVLGYMFALHVRETQAVEPVLNEREHDLDDFG